jgi:hypothetical protein
MPSPGEEGNLRVKRAKTEFEFDVAISFAGKDRSKAKSLADALKKSNFRVFYDQDELHQLWGKDLFSVLTEVYQKKCRFCLMLLSKNYRVARWPGLERRAAQARQLFGRDSDFILPVRLDNSVIPGVLPTAAYLPWTNGSPGDIVELLRKKALSEVASESINSLECFWYQDLLQRNKLANDPRPAHIVKATHIDEDPAGCEADIYDAWCGESMEGYYFHNDIEGKRGLLAQARLEGYELCYQCAWLWNRAGQPRRR